MKRDYEINENNETGKGIGSFGFFVIFVYFVISLQFINQIIHCMEFLRGPTYDIHSA